MTQRRLAAILAADMVGYSRLMAADEAGTLERLKALRREIIDPEIARQGGEIVKLTGDGMLVLFGSVVDAVEAAAAVQNAVKAAEAAAPGERRIAFRVGLHLGDVILDEGDIYGDGVNIAARLEAEAEPGGVTLSDDAFRQVRGKTGLGFTDLGERRLKNIPEPVRVFAVADGRSEDLPAGDLARLAPPERPSVAVLPFATIGDDPDQAMFADGLADEIVTMLAKIDGLFVVAFGSTAGYRGRAMDVRQVGREQGVGHVLDGTVRRAGERLRVSARLSDAATGRQIWAERFEGSLDDVFAVQDEITREVTVALQVELTEGDQARVRAGSTRNFAAWELTARGAELVSRHRREDNVRARGLLERAVALDPDYAAAWCQLGWCHWADARHLWSGSEADSLARAREMGERAAQLDPDGAEPPALLAMTAMQEGRFDDAARLAAEAGAAAGGHSFVLAIAAMVTSYCGDPQAAIALMRRAMRLSPTHPNWYRVVLSRSLYLAGEHAAVIELLSGWDGFFEGTFAFPVYLVAALVEEGREDEARRIASAALAAEPDFTISRWRAPQKFRDPAALARLTRALEALGLPR